MQLGRLAGPELVANDLADALIDTQVRGLAGVESRVGVGRRDGRDNRVADVP